MIRRLNPPRKWGHEPGYVLSISPVFLWRLNMAAIQKIEGTSPSSLNPVYLNGDAFSRLDESDDRIFYATDRFVSHLDSFALSTVKKIIGDLIIEDHPVILDLMAGWDSHIPENRCTSKVVGLGLNESELKQNSALSARVIHDLNKDPRLPFPDSLFDAVINTVSVDYMTRPVEVFQEVGRILKPGGLFLLIFSNRMFPQKAVKVWKESSEEERVLLVEDFFRESAAFGKITVFVSKGKPRPQEDKYAYLGIPSDPIYAVYAEKKGGDHQRKPRPSVTIPYGEPLDEEELARREHTIKETLCCPYCGERMHKWAVPDNPFEVTWDNEFMYICFNDACPYYVRGWDFMYKDGNRGASYRLMYNPEKDCCMPIPVPSPRALRESIIE
jgi:SAM-dependent methyltransferase